MTFKLAIKCDNEAFAEWNGIEIARILRGLADRVDGDAVPFDFGARLMDINGNAVGEALVTRE